MRLNVVGLLATMLAAGVVGGEPATAAGQPDVTEGFSRAYQACITYGEVHNTTAIPQAECDARELRAQDARLNSAYKAAMARLSSKRKADLRADERNWILARDHRCAKLPDPDLSTECTIDETIKRTVYLRQYR